MRELPNDRFPSFTSKHVIRKSFHNLTVALSIVLFLGAAALSQTLEVLAHLSQGTGTSPGGALVQGLDGNLYGTTGDGGAYLSGTVFKVTLSGVVTTLHSFSCAFPCGPSGLVLSTDGDFYGTTQSGGTKGLGDIYKITPTGARTTLHNFSAFTGLPSGLIQASNGQFYGTTEYGGTAGGTLFRISPQGELTTLYSFCPQTPCRDGNNPLGALAQGIDGNLYGTTQRGGLDDPCAGGCGTFFRATIDGVLTDLHAFNLLGHSPASGVIQGVDGNFYGTTSPGFETNPCSPTCGTVFKMSPGGTVTVLHVFCAASTCPDGAKPYSSLIQASDGNFYGTTLYGGTGAGCGSIGCGTIFKITPEGELTTLYSFAWPNSPSIAAALLQGTDGKLYGTTYAIIFSLDLGLSPFVKTLPTFGVIGKTIRILGNNLTGSTVVSFHGVAAKFTVVSDAEIDAVVPAGAVTGTVHVKTPTATLASYPVFHVMPQVKSFSPASGPAGTVVTITGLSFTPVKGVQFNGVQAPGFGVVNDTSIAVTVPTGATTGPIKVFSPGGAATSAQTFTVTQ